MGEHKGDMHPEEPGGCLQCCCDNSPDIAHNKIDNFRQNIKSRDLISRRRDKSPSGEKTVAEWKTLYGFLFTRFMDGNVKTRVEGHQNPKVEQPGYSPDWYRKVAEETGDKFKVPEEEGAGH